MDHTFYACPYCKEEYTNPVDLAHCILSCEDKKKREEENRKKEELALAKEVRKKEVDDALRNYNTLLKAYIKDYGVYSLTTDTDDFIAMGRLLPYWF